MIRLTLISFLFLLSACGGGGSSSPSNPSPNPSPTPTPPPAEQSAIFGKYTGIKREASVEHNEAHDIAYQITSTLDLSHFLSYASDAAYVRFDSMITEINTSLAEDCESGQLIVGEPIDDRVSVEYVECVVDNYKVSGVGTLTAIAFDASGELVVGKLSFDNLSVKKGGQQFRFEGTIEATLGQVTTDTAIYNALIENLESGEQVYLDNFQIGFEIPNQNLGYGVKGKVYLSPYGFVLVDTLRNSLHSSQLTELLMLEVEGKNTLIIEALEQQKIGLALYANSQSIGENRIEIPFSYIASQAYLSDVNTPPVASASLLSHTFDKNQHVILDASQSQDNEYDLLDYQWQVVSQPVGANATLSNNGFVNSFTEFTVAGDYQLSLTVSDGELQSAPSLINLYVRQDPALASFSQQIQQIEYAELLQDQVLVDNPTDDGPFTYKLRAAPLGVTIDEQGGLYWDGRMPRFGYDIDVNIRVVVSNRDHDVEISRSLKVIEPSPSKMFQIDEFNKQVITTFNFNSDQQKDLFVLQGQNATIISPKDGSVLWQNELPIGEIQALSFDSEQRVIYIVEKHSGRIFQIDSDNKITLLPTTLTHNYSTLSHNFPITGRQSDGNLMFYGSDRRLDISNDLAENYPTYAYAIGDIDGNGILDLFTSQGMYRSDDMQLMTDSSNIPPGIQTASFYDMNADGSEELFISYTEAMGIDARYDLAIFTMKDDNLARLQTITGNQVRMSFTLTPGGQQLHVMESSDTIATYSRDEDNIYHKVGVKTLADMNLQNRY